MLKRLSPKKIALFRALQLGDLLCAVPALRSLKAALPGSRIELVGLPWAKEFARRFSNYLDGFLEFPGYPGLPEIEPDIRKFPEFVKEAQSRQYDLAIQLHGSGSYVNSLTVLLGAKRNAGFYLEGEYCPDPEGFMRWPEGDPEILRLLQLPEFLGAPFRGDHLEFPILPEDRQAFDELPESRYLQPGSYACIHPGARLSSRRWGAERFAAVADELAAKLGLEIVLTGSQEERPLAQAVASKMRKTAIDLSGKTTLGSLAVLLTRCRLVVSNDTGVSHVAAALSVPSVVVYTGSSLERWAPLDRRLHRAVTHPVPCRPCSYAECPIGQPCAAGVTPQQVLDEAGLSLKEKAA